MNNSIILTHTQIVSKIKRIAAQILESNFMLPEIILIGVNGNGLKLATLLKNEIEKLESPSVKVLELVLDKKNPVIENVIINPDYNLKNKSVVLVDDVLNSGKTLSYGLAALLKLNVSAIQTAVLINRSYKNFPVFANFVGLSLTTTLHDYVMVDFNEGEFTAYTTSA
jgi:pyrimidine operon attenuation protein/uracil phosphoribosyltransferase